MAATEPAATSSRRRIGLGLHLAVSLLALGGVAWWASQQTLPDLPSFETAAGPLALALALYAAVTMLRGERWRGILAMGGADVARTDAYALTVVGYMGNNALPARAGDLMKAIISAHRAHAPRRDAFGALVAERLLDAVALCAIFSVLVVVAGLPVGLSPALLTLLGAGLVVAAGVVLMVAPRLRGLLASLLAPSRALFSRRGAGLLGISLIVWLTEGAVYSLIGRAAGLDLSLADGLYVMALANIAAMVPAAPGYVGTYDAAVLLAVRLVGGGTRAVALPYVVLLRFVLFVPIAVVGLVFLVSRYGGLRTLRTSEAAAPA